MNAKLCQANYSAIETAYSQFESLEDAHFLSLQQLILDEMQAKVGANSRSLQSVAERIAREVERVCRKSARIQSSGDIKSHLIHLGHHRINKCLYYYQKGSQRGRTELHANLSMMVYRHIARADAQLGFSARYNAIEDFLQDFYVESLRAFRKENELPADYQPRTPLELAEYMAFTEQYAKRRINLPNGYSQQLIILRAQSFARRQPHETAIDIEQAAEYGKGEEGELQSRNPAVQQVRAQMVAETPDPWEDVRRDRVVNSLIQYLEAQGHSDCADYLVLKLEDRSAAEIDEILGLTPRQRDYLQQRFKYHVEKFSRASENWKLVHQWLGADLDQKLGLNSEQWQALLTQLSEVQRELLQLKQEGKNDAEIAKMLKLSAKKLQKQWTQILELAAKVRNSNAN
ncbi:HetZ-related protein [Oscillatoria sp. FACHB-1406]|uniref:HetZ-related protein n=1 Tax=Oscillatoria sp. FACHB-1406 TaxID=2692846 RepID=UPI001684A5EB|nr:HetZ-related protein [Oscillatoria sp. FACHB-1406]MBD2578078.1 HetZ-related protein [Oscillatoria sp. FACHB-1406]